MKRQAAALQLPVPRTFDLTHVEPEHFAAALGNDPVRIFEFVRDNIAYEAYTGLLRGPRGTLLAMAGNSVDRAALLAALLHRAGQRVRYARGTLPEREAQELVSSMWADRPPALQPREAASTGQGQPRIDALTVAVNRDYTMIRDHLKQRGVERTRESAPTLQVLVAAARAHYWVQWWKDGRWTDLDPSFADAPPGRTYTRAEETTDTLPEAVFHRITFRVRLEEYTDGTPSTRELLTHTLNAADLSGIDVLLIHQPENWQGPASSLGSAIASAVTDTGRVKPILLWTDRAALGESFSPRIKTGGIGSIPSMLSGEGTRKAVPIATAEWLEADFSAPDGSRQTVSREIFDIVGKARRAAGQTLTADEVRTLTEREDAFDVLSAIYDLFVTNGRVEAGHLAGVADDAVPAEEDFVDFRTVLRRINIGFAAASDGLLARLGQPGRSVILFYPDSPRLTISELSVPLTGPRLALDLRRDFARPVVWGPQPEDVFPAMIVRGVVDGTLERLIVEAATGALREQEGWGPVMSTSSLFEQAAGQRIPVLLLPRDKGRLDRTAPPDALARLGEEEAQGYLSVAPQRPLALAGMPRLAWWRVHPRTGETVAVTDEGLHQTATDYKVHEADRAGNVRVSVRYVYGPRGQPMGPGSLSQPSSVAVRSRTFNISTQEGMSELGNFVRQLLAQGARPVARGQGLGSLPISVPW